MLRNDDVVNVNAGDFTLLIFCFVIATIAKLSFCLSDVILALCSARSIASAGDGFEFDTALSNNNSAFDLPLDVADDNFFFFPDLVCGRLLDFDDFVDKT